MDTFLAIDLETANADMASICQIGIATFQNNKLIKEWSSLVDPEDFFDEINISIHGITEDTIRGAPTLPEIYPEIQSVLNDVICVSHTHFDRVSLNRALQEYSLEPLNVQWLDSAKVARRTWEEIAYKGYGLANVCQLVGYEFQHHDALEDAKACGEVLLAAINKSGIDLNSWLARSAQPIRGGSYSTIALEGNPEGELYGQTVVFTGALSLPRREAAALAAKAGCAVTSSVTKKTNYLVVGDQDITKLAGKKKSSKHLKAEQLILSGQPIRILKESDFMILVNS